MRCIIINGPGLSFLGRREPSLYGKESLSEIKKYTLAKLRALGFLEVYLEWFESHLEGDLVGKIYEACEENYHGMVINPGGYSHTSVAVLDAMRAFPFPIAEVHLTNTLRREGYRQNRLTGQAANYVIEGALKNVYTLGVCSILWGGELS